jgi:cytochrome c
LAQSGVVWDDATLTEWLKAPSRLIKGVKMTFRLTNDQDIADVIAYLKANSPGAD